MSKKVRRLYESFQPQHYILDIDPDRDDMSIKGTVIITGNKTGRPSQRLTFHQNKLKITSATITKNDKKGDRDIAVGRINHHGSFNEVRLHAGEMIYPGQYTIRMTFEGVITRPMDGIYPCFFTHEGVEKKLIATQFESHHAREAFPCIDEPEAKATFELTLHSPTNETVISNTPVKHQEEKDGKLVTTFEHTPMMSTYLLAFIYGELPHLEAKTKHGVVVRTYATSDNVQFTDFALDTAVKCLEFYTDYFDIPYPLAKCDLVALPDFASGAMENWGCITFREHGLIVDPENTSLPTKQYVAEVVAHELTHQWFGNLVTMRWWTDLWLNEGFASWMAYLAPAKLFPEWDLWSQYIVDEQHVGLKLDALENTHPVEVPIGHPDEIRTIFDGISYNKGSSMIHMIANYLGPRDFRDGLRYYLKTHAYSNTDTVDLWDALEKISKKPVREFMGTWTGQSGYPIVHAHVGDNEFHLEQEPFLLNPLRRNPKEEGGPLWPVPLEAGKDLPALFDTPDLTLDINEPDHLMLNQGRSGFYRTVYNASHLERLADSIRRGRIEPLDRLGLLNDTFEAAKAGFEGTAEALKLLEAYKHEDNTFVWDVIATNIAAMRNVMNNESLREAMKPYIRKLVALQLERLGWDEKNTDSHFDRLLRPTILGLSAAADEAWVVTKCVELFESMEKPTDLSPDLRGIIYTTAARKGDEKTFEKLLKMHNQSNSSEERITLAAALTNFHQPALTSRALALITSEHVRLQDIIYWVAYSFGNRFARKATWEWAKANWPWLKDNIGTDLAFFNMPLYAARNSSDKAFLEDFKTFFASVDEPGLSRSIRQGIEIIEWQSEWKKRDLATIKAFFKA